jgi:sugar lactone lactonase YvrE
MATAFSHEAREADDTTIVVRAEPNGLAFDRDREALYVADAKSAAVIRIEGRRHTRIASLPPNTILGSNHLAGLTVTPYGTIYAARLGYGRTGAVLQIEPDGDCVALPRLPARFWRVGVAYDGLRHRIYSTQFLKSASGPFEGSVIAIDLATGDVTTVVEDLLKPVGVAAFGHVMVVSDARMKVVLRLDLVEGRAVSRSVLADGLRPDAICAVDARSLLVTSYDDVAHEGALDRLWLDGRRERIASGPWQPRGVATDGERAYVSAKRGGRVLVLPL